MLTTTATVTTDRAGRYLGQLCRHLTEMGSARHHGAPPDVLGVDRTESEATIRFADGTCTLKADETALAVRVEADDAQALHRLREAIGRRIGGIGRRDGLTVHWG